MFRVSVSARTPRTARVRPAAGLLILLSVAGLLAAACGSGSGSSSNTATPPASATTTAARPAYEAAGPYAAGVTSLKLSTGADVEVWYPATKASVAGKAQDIFSISSLLPAALKSLVPADIDPKYPTGAYRDVPASTAGPFPLVMFSHGYAAYPTMYANLGVHLASWGYVMVAPDHTERDLLAALAAGLSTTTTVASTDSVQAAQAAQAAQRVAVMGDAQTLLAARDAAVAASHDASSVLHSTVDPAEQATMGHSAGAAAAAQAAVTDVDPGVKTFILLSGSGVTGTPAPTKPGMVITGGNDHVAALSRETAYYQTDARAQAPGGDPAGRAQLLRRHLRDRQGPGRPAGHRDQGPHQRAAHVGSPVRRRLHLVVSRRHHRVAGGLALHRGPAALGLRHRQDPGRAVRLGDRPASRPSPSTTARPAELPGQAGPGKSGRPREDGAVHGVDGGEALDRGAASGGGSGAPGGRGP